MDKLREIFKDRLRLRLDQKNITQQALANEIGVTLSTVQKWVQGLRWPQSEIICQLADALDVTPQWLLGGTSENHLPGAVPKEILRMLVEWPENSPWDQLLAIAEVRLESDSKNET